VIIRLRVTSAHGRSRLHKHPSPTPPRKEATAVFLSTRSISAWPLPSRPGSILQCSRDYPPVLREFVEMFHVKHGRPRGGRHEIWNVHHTSPCVPSGCHPPLITHGVDLLHDA